MKITPEIPNALTVIRILLAIVFPLAPVSWHAAVIGVALATEFFDGYLARRFHWDSKTGERLDPVADKLFFISVCLTWVWMGKLSWPILLLMGIRDIGVALLLLLYIVTGRYSLSRFIRPTRASKLTTVFQYVTFFAIFWWKAAVPVLVFLTATTAVIALAQYIVLLRRQSQR
jgi:phosphatidylglycerophosphate synthase